MSAIGRPNLRHCRGRSELYNWTEKSSREIDPKDACIGWCFSKWAIVSDLNLPVCLLSLIVPRPRCLKMFPFSWRSLVLCMESCECIVQFCSCKSLRTSVPDGNRFRNLAHFVGSHAHTHTYLPQGASATRFAQNVSLSLLPKMLRPPVWPYKQVLMNEIRIAERRSIRPLVA